MWQWDINHDENSGDDGSIKNNFMLLFNNIVPLQTKASEVCCLAHPDTGWKSGQPEQSGQYAKPKPDWQG